MQYSPRPSGPAKYLERIALGTDSDKLCVIPGHLRQAERVFRFTLPDAGIGSALKFVRRISLRYLESRVCAGGNFCRQPPAVACRNVYEAKHCDCLIGRNIIPGHLSQAERFFK